MPIALAPVLDTAAAAPLRQAMRAAIDTGQSIKLDASAVERVGQACLQVLVATEAAADLAGLDFRVVGASPAFADMATLAALDTLLAA